MKNYAVAATVLCICTSYVLVSALTELTSAPIAAQTAAEYTAATSLAPLAVSNDIKIKSSKAKYRYKSDNVSDAEQTWALAAETLTAYSSFDQISNVHMRARVSGKPDSLDHQFSIKPSGITAGGTAYKGRFFPWDNLGGSQIKSGGSEHKYACGMFKAKLVPDKATGMNRLVFLYAVTSASRMGLMGETNRFQEMKDYLVQVGKTNGVIDTEYSMSLSGLEHHDVAGQTSFKAGVKNAAGKIVKPPPAHAN